MCVLRIYKFKEYISDRVDLQRLFNIVIVKMGRLSYILWVLQVWWIKGKENKIVEVI